MYYQADLNSVIFSETAAISSDTDATHPLKSGIQLKLTCKYTTANLKADSLKWMQNGNEFTTTQKALLSTGPVEGDLSVSIYTVATIAITDSGSYTCSAGYTVGETQPTATSPTFTLTVLGEFTRFTRLLAQFLDSYFHRIAILEAPFSSAKNLAIIPVQTVFPRRRVHDNEQRRSSRRRQSNSDM